MKWTKQELIILKNYYLNTSGDFFDVKELVSILGRSESSITARASKLGLGNAKRKVSIKSKERMKKAQRINVKNPEEIERRSRAMKRRIANGEKIKRFTGKKHTQKQRRLSV